MATITAPPAVNPGYYNQTTNIVNGKYVGSAAVGGLSVAGQQAENSATTSLLGTLATYQQQLGLAAEDKAQATADNSQVAGYQQEVAGYQGEQAAYGQEYDAYGNEIPAIQGEVSAYQKEAQIAQQNATLEQSAGNIATYQQGLAAQQTIGQQKAAVAAGGFGESGSALSLLGSSTRQAALTAALGNIQTNINVQGYQQQAAGATASASAASGQIAAVQGMQAGAKAQEAAATGAIGGANAAAAAAEGTANVANVAAANATKSAAFNQTLATNEASTIAQIDAGNVPPGYVAPGSGTSNFPNMQAPSTGSSNLQTAQSAFSQAGLSAPAAVTAPATAAAVPGAPV